ncbi:MAG: hypothetical protein R3C68_04890 [Myxococcota bacterium]
MNHIDPWVELNDGDKKMVKTKHRAHYVPITMGTIALGLIAACGGNSLSDDALANELSQSFGALEATDEEPLFGEASVFAELGEAEADRAAAYSDDTVADEAADETDRAIDDALIPPSEGEPPLVFGIRAGWGRWHRDPEATSEAIRWNPTFRTDCGVISVRRLVAMEEGEGVVRPRDSAQEVSFYSATLRHIDGAFLIVALRNRECAATGQLHITSEALETAIEVPLAELADTALRVAVGESNHFAIDAHQVEPSGDNDCVKGTMAGRWRSTIERDGNTNGTRGRVYGRILDELGELRGHVRGIYGVPERGLFAGQQVFYGKLIRLDGSFVGLMAGRYGEGKFGGGWHLNRRFNSLRGLVGGHYASALDRDPDGGEFGARYASTSCLQRVQDERPLAETDISSQEGADR